QTVSLGEDYVETICGDIHEELIYTYEVCETISDNPFVDPYDEKDNKTVPEEDKGDGSEEEHIDSDDLTDKEKCINDFLTSKGNTFVKEIMQNFKGNSEFDIKIQSVDRIFGENNDDLNGETRFTLGNEIIFIDISSYQANQNSALEVARTILHEYIHADMLRKLNTSDQTNEVLDFIKTYEKYKQTKFEPTAQHETMAELYLKSMEDALKDFYKNVLVGDYNYNTNNGTNPLPDSFYEALAWRGLKDHNVQAYKDLSNTKKQELEKALTDHFHSITKSCPN
ncbi:hypothetical protein EGM88_15150, partial [Aureibaculum marinum]